ncbi:zinc transporter substrate-binding protein [Synechococcus sp. WH 8020]|uniref:metal ABC transporter solute-binding protein, Zn/Mn family n=1 Tax=Synechococcus sp. (strain WH8020) TaxID=32052 RepID=UPI0006528037|nr:zinc ABC transporter substrate-binding protein [Synechococcus sp. WH 8020]AKN60507.1 zinc transporter substrate-binding protein [Synechococcus sp. WH 8020]
MSWLPSSLRPKSLWSVSGTLLLMAALVSCGTAQKTHPKSDQSKLNVVTTFLPITLFTEAVAGECATVTALIPPNLGPHDFQATPSDIAALSKASVLVKNGLGMEYFLDKLTDSAENDSLQVIDTSRGVAVIESDEDEGGDHDHDHDHDHGEVNPHIWLDPLRAVQQVENIRDGLVKADPDCADGYTQRASAYSDQLKELNTTFATQLKPFSGKTFIAFHDFAPYFAERYDLKAEFVVDVPEMNPTPADLQRVSNRVEQTQLKALLSEPQEGDRSFNAVAEDLGVNVVTFDPLETGSEEASKQPDTYFKVMKSNVASLIKAFGG